MTGVVITSAARTAVGSYGKSLASMPPSELGAIASTAALERSGIGGSTVEHVVFGNVIHTEAADAYMARVVGIKSGVPKAVPAYTVNRLCGSGVQAIVSGCQSIQTGEASVVLAGGAESMSRGPYWLPEARWGVRSGGAQLVDSVLGALTDPFDEVLMGITAENLAGPRGITRERQDAYALESQRRAAAARAEGRFERQIVSAVVKGRAGDVEFDRDEHIREDVDPESLARLKPAFKSDGSVTAGNSSGMNDAGAAVVLMSAERAEQLGVSPRAQILGYASCGVPPEIMGIGPVPAVQRVLRRCGYSLGDVEVIELNEAFAAQALAVIDELGLDPRKVNPNGGAIALGHPIGATGAVLTVKILDEMERSDLKLGIVTLCIGGGQGIAMLLGRGI